MPHSTVWKNLQGQKLGKGDNPLLVSVRSGAKFSMPGMMDTILNLGLNDQSVEALAKRSNNPRFAADSYRRLIQMFGSVVLEIPKHAFDEVFDAKKKQKKAKLDTELDAKALKEVIEEYKKVVKKHTKHDFPQDPHEQLVMARDAVFRSWQNDRAKHYRRINNIDDMLGTAVNVQAMVFGNLGDTSGTGVGFTRNPATGAKEFYGEFLMNAQGEDVVAGIRTPVPILELQKVMPAVYDQLREITTRLEKHYKDMQDFEFTIQEGKLTCCKPATANAPGRQPCASPFRWWRKDSSPRKKRFSASIPTRFTNSCCRAWTRKSGKVEVLATGFRLRPARRSDRLSSPPTKRSKKRDTAPTKNPVILVRAETTPEDIHGMEVAAGILTSRGGMTSHAAVVTRGMGKCCVAGAGDIEVDEKAREMRVKGPDVQSRRLDLARWHHRTRDQRQARHHGCRSPTILNCMKLMSWAEPFRKLGVRANADIPRDAIQARAFGAEGIGLCRTEHMFFGEKKLPHMRAMILANTEKDRRAALKKLLPLQRADFVGVFRAMDGFPVTIRTLDPPLHEFLPRREDLMVEIAVLEATKPKSPEA